MRKKTLLLLLIISLSFASGCWDYTEYEKLAPVFGIAVDFDKKTGETTVAQQYLIPKGGGKGPEGGGASSTKTGLVYSATAKSLYEAITKLQQVVVERIFYGYLNVYVVGEETAKYNLKDQIELIDRTPAIRDIAYFIVTPGKAEKVLSTVDENIASTSSQQIVSLLNNAKSTGAAFPVTIHDATEVLAIEGWELTVPCIISTAQDSTKSEVGTEDGIHLDEKYKGGFRAAGMAAFKGDKLVGWLNPKETIGLGWITGKPLTVYKVSTQPEGTDVAQILYFRILKSGGKIKVKLVNNEPVIYVNVSASADLRKYFSQSGSDYIDPKEIKKVETLLADSIRSDIQAALTKGQNELQSDIFGFGFAFFRKYPRLWKSDYAKIWPEIYPDIPVEVTVKTKILNTGTNIRKLIVK